MKKFLKKYEKTAIFGLGVFFLALFLRIYNLNSLPIFGDEAIYIRWSQVMRAEPTLRFVPLSDGKQPLFMWCVIPLFKVFSDPLIAGRIVSVLSGLGTLIGIFVLSYILFQSFRLSLIAGLLYAISPFSIFFDRIALADSALSFFGIWVLIFSLITAMKVRLDTAMLAGFFLGGALLTKSPAVFYAILIPFSLIFTRWPKDFKEKFNKLSIFVFLFSFTYLIAYGLYNILRLGPNFQMISIRNADYVLPFKHLFVNPLDPLKPNLIKSIGWFYIMGPGILLMLFITSIFSSLKKYRKELFLLVAWGILTIVVQAEFAKVFTARYIFFSLPYIFIASAVLFKHRRYKVIKTLLLVLFILVSLKNDYLMVKNIARMPLPQSERSGYLEEWTAGTGIKEVANYLKQEYQSDPGRKIVVGTEGFFGTLPDGLQMYLNGIPQITVIGVGIDLSRIPTSLIESKKSGNETYLVINRSRLLIDPNSLGLEIVSVYPKALREKGTREYNTLGPQDTLYLFRL